MVAELWERLRGRAQRDLSRSVACRRRKMLNESPLISFTFDDFPRSALHVGGRILRSHGAVGTYYVALGLMNRDEPVGRICNADDLADLLAVGHELGCHTYGHHDAWATPPRLFEESILANRRALGRLLPGATFETMSYPINSPRPGAKRRAGRHFACCRGGDQRINVGTMDLSYLRAFFLEQSRERPAAVWEAIERNRQERGWLIFATHDVSPRPSPFGCTPEFFGEAVRRALASGARILPVARALAAACGGGDSRVAGGARSRAGEASASG
jgi:peptidoglycan/xylan/chitin deacetylase (PgdA/CDA1 family)